MVKEWEREQGERENETKTEADYKRELIYWDISPLRAFLLCMPFAEPTQVPKKNRHSELFSGADQHLHIIGLALEINMAQSSAKWPNMLPFYNWQNMYECTLNT